VDTTVSSRAAASTALSNATWTDALAATLANVKPIPKIKIQTNGIVADSVYLGTSDTYRFPQQDNYSGSDNIIDTDYQCGYRFIVSNDSTDVLINVVNISGSGWVFCLHQFNNNTNSNCQFNLIVDGITVYDSTYTAGTLYTARIVVGRAVYTSSGAARVGLAALPLRYNSSLQVQRRSSSANSYTVLVYVPD
jgi:hypothetical protein